MRGDHFSESAWADGRGVEVSISWLLVNECWSGPNLGS